MQHHESYMRRCLELAQKGLGQVAPNPMVGAVLVHDDKIIGEGWHQAYGQAHAEVNAIAAVQDESLLKDCTLYVNLEPCSHHGKTPPCADLIIAKGIPRVVIGNVDTNPLVGGRGIAKLEAAGVEIVHGVLKDEARELNKRFFTFHEQKRPYVILKWAQTADGFISKWPVPANRSENQITGAESQMLVHLWRSQEQAIMVGTNTVLADDPQLTTRLVNGRNPVRVVLDRHLKLAKDKAVFNQQADTIVFNAVDNRHTGHIKHVMIDFDKPVVPQVLQGLYRQGISSLIVEGGTTLLQSFIESGPWDEARVFENPQLMFGSGLRAPVLDLNDATIQSIGRDQLFTLKQS